MATTSNVVRPKAAAVPSGSRVVLVISRGPVLEPAAQPSQVPVVIGSLQGSALERIEATGLRAQVFTDFNEIVPRGHAVDQFPRSGATVEPGSEVVVLISNGPAERTDTPPPAVVLPDTVGMSEPEAIEALRAVKLEPEVVRDYHPNVVAGVVIGQLPSQSAVIAERPAPPNRTWLWVLLAVIVAALLGVGAFVLLIGTQVSVPEVTGLTQAQAQKQLASAGFKLGAVTTQSGSSAAEGTVISQQPQGGSLAKGGSRVALVLAAPRQRVAVPNVVGLSEAAASAQIAAAGLTSQSARRYSDSVAIGTVIDEIPAAGEMAPLGSAVTISISLGPQSTTFSMPDFSNAVQSDATNKAASLGLLSRVTNEYSTPIAVGHVVSQLPASGEAVTTGKTIALSVSLGPAPASGAITVPDVSGMSSANANSAIVALGLTSVAVQWDGTGLPADSVVGQSPRAGSLVPTGNSVVVFVSSGK